MQIFNDNHDESLFKTSLLVSAGQRVQPTRSNVSPASCPEEPQTVNSYREMFQHVLATYKGHVDFLSAFLIVFSFIG